MARTRPTYVQVAESFSVGNEVFKVGKVYGSNHPLARKFKQYFKPLEVEGEDPVEDATAAPQSRSGVEQATAAPGEKRARPSKAFVAPEPTPPPEVTTPPGSTQVEKAGG